MFLSSPNTVPRMLMLITTALMAFISAVTAQDCYFPDGSLDGDAIVADQNNVTSGVGSACCHQGDTYANGTCIAQSEANSFPPKVIYRPSCTTQQWDTPGCPTVCRSNTPSNTTWLLPCRNADGSACCYTDTSAPSCNCFGAGFGPPSFLSNFASFAGGPPASATASPASAVSTPGSVAASPTADAASDGSEAESGDGSSGRTVGLAVGLSLGIVLAIAGVLFALYYRRNMAKKAAAAEAAAAEPQELESARGGEKGLEKYAELDPGAAAELPPYGAHSGAGLGRPGGVQEMEASAGQRYELDAGGVKKEGEIGVGELEGEGRKDAEWEEVKDGKR
ncbi:hypothetical protein EJ05DRAFT_542168 [Pseudovirgaria hyperparasitica]|uniref:Mid2 domain-containing protein n=1 Tax=Pseudovirgaria hyperparasitica TaxID=470096 RepID=A0A6A6VV86_9PEZI|nr:uncharacterized protein EJ05DRAFT_542168 [Pseudovirgaria hyperparasitica]KAF2753161.1 hypothetical protein EJ05DRAFT_542168 [Pseudovirgaria hyperparasitica]